MATAVEKKIITKIQHAIEKHMHADTREGGHYFDHECVKPFNEIAQDIAAVIAVQGVKKTEPVLVEIAREINATAQVFGDDIMKNHNLGYCFSKAMEKMGTPMTARDAKHANPFKKFKL